MSAGRCRAGTMQLPKSPSVSSHHCRCERIESPLTALPRGSLCDIGETIGSALKLHKCVWLSLNVMELLNSLSKVSVCFLVRQKPQRKCKQGPLRTRKSQVCRRTCCREGRALGLRDSAQERMTLKGGLPVLSCTICRESPHACCR